MKYDDPQKIFDYLTGDSPEMTVARLFYAKGMTEAVAQAQFKLPPLNRLPDPTVLRVINHLRDLWLSIAR